MFEETVDMLFCTATFDLAPQASHRLKPVLPPVASLCQMLRRLSLRDLELYSLFYDSDDLVGPARDAGVDSIKILSLPNLKYLEMKTEIESRGLTDCRWAGWRCHSWIMLWLINYRKSFTLELRLVVTDDAPVTETLLTAVYSAGRLKFEYSEQAKTNLEGEKLLHRAMCLGGGARMIEWMNEIDHPDWTQFGPGSEARQHLREIIDEDRLEIFEQALDEFRASRKLS